MIRVTREAKGFTLQELASKVGMDWSQLSKVERGLSGTDLETYERIARALGLTLAQLVGAHAKASRRPAVAA